MQVRSSALAPAVAAPGRSSDLIARHALASLPSSLQTVSRRASVAAAAAGDSGGGAGDFPDLRELTKDDFHSCLEEAGDQLVVIDFFTDW